MTSVVAESAKNNAQNNAQNTVKREVSSKNSAAAATLDASYRQIGILAVVAAARYHGAAKNPAYAPVTNNWRDRAEDAAA